MSVAESLFGEPAVKRTPLDVLVAAALIDEAGARRAAQTARQTNESQIAVVHQLALADDSAVVAALAEHFQMPLVAPDEIPAAAIEISGLSAAFLRRHRVLPLGWAGDCIIAGVIDPDASHGLAALSFAAGKAAEPRLMSASAQKRAFDALYGAAADGPLDEFAVNAGSSWTDDAARMRDHADAGPAVRLVDALLEHALEQNASDIHIEPLPDRVRIRFRVDGDLIVVREEPAQLAAPIAARIKILADMDVADRRSAQDGRTSLAARGRPVDVRISTVPSAYGETVALRLLRREASLLNFAALGFEAHMIAMFERVLALRRGLFLLTGPTGSGKTTTLYAMIERLRGHALKILSIEDPIEYFFGDITQVQVNEDAGLTFPSALRAFLRQDPDVILIGEIRDGETARIAVQAALTGHLVLATLHTSDALGAAPRLVDMGVDRYLVAATLAGAAAQRLARKVCPHCRTTRPPTDAERELLAPHVSEPLTIAAPQGCAQCRQTGFAGRTVVAEGYLLDDALREALLDASGARAQAVLSKASYRHLMASAAGLAARGDILPADVRALALT